MSDSKTFCIIEDVMTSGKSIKDIHNTIDSNYEDAEITTLVVVARCMEHWTFAPMFPFMRINLERPEPYDTGS